MLSRHEYGTDVVIVAYRTETAPILLPHRLCTDLEANFMQLVISGIYSYCMVTGLLGSKYITNYCLFCACVNGYTGMTGMKIMASHEMKVTQGELLQT